MQLSFLSPAPDLILLNLYIMGDESKVDLLLMETFERLFKSNENGPLETGGLFSYVIINNIDLYFVIFLMC